ncbi:MAG: hypothetical protein JNK48_06855 [Bryobacterales bacterium]|nr:hypothetical protein [Bryobacterales bacterium]
MKWSLALLPAALYGQCAQCFRTASAQQAAGMRALNQGILILLILVLAMLAGIAWLAYRRRDA